MDHFRTTFGPLLDHFWTTFGPLLDHFWTTFGPFLDYFWNTFRPLSQAISKVIRGCGPSMSWIKLLFNISLQLTIQVPKNLSVVHIIFLFVELLLSALNFPLSRGAEIRFLHPSVCHSLTARIRSAFCHAFCLVINHITHTTHIQCHHNKCLFRNICNKFFNNW